MSKRGMHGLPKLFGIVEERAMEESEYMYSVLLHRVLK